MYTFPTLPHSSHHTTLLNAKVLNLYMTQVGISKLGSTEIHLSSQVSKWMGHRLQSSCPEATAIHILKVPGWVFVLRQDGALAHRASDTVAFLEHRYSTSFLQHCGRRIHRILTKPTIYSIFSVLQEKVCLRGWTKKASDRRVERFDQSIVNAAIAEWRRCRLNARVRMSGHTLSTKYINSAILSSTYQY